MSLDKIAVFNDQVKLGTTEVLQQQIDKFNAASSGAIVLRSKANMGDYRDESFWKDLGNTLVRRRNAYGSGPVAALDLEQLVDTAVKVAAGMPPVNIPPSQMLWIQENPEVQAAVVSQQLAKAMLADMLNTSIGAARAALRQVGAAVYYDNKAVGDGKATWNALNFGKAKFGDQAQRIAAWVTHSKPTFDLWDKNLTNGNSLFSFGTVNVVADPWGTPLIVTDSDSLIDPDGSGTGPDVPSYFLMGLVSGAILVEDNGDYIQNISTTNGEENIQRTMQSEWSFQLGIKGFSWDKANGGKSPTTSALTTGTNWDRTATDHKNLAGVLVETK